MKTSNNTISNKRLSTILISAFFLVSILEIAAEYLDKTTLVWITKPLVLPILVAYYCSLTQVRNRFFLTALFFSWVANIFFIQNNIPFIKCGVVFYLLYRIFIILIVLKKAKFPSVLPVVIGIIPFMSLYIAVTVFTFHVLGSNVYLFLAQGLFTILLGGLSLSTFIIYTNKLSTLLFFSTMLLVFNQFVFVLKLYYNQVHTLQAIAMILFVLGQFLLTRYIYLLEKNVDDIKALD